ncbi:hypothetical protein AB0K14_33045 [Actinosynnema sp. NPDC050801]
MKPAPEVAFGDTGRETPGDDGAARQQELVDEVCGYLLGSWSIWFPGK